MRKIVVLGSANTDMVITVARLGAQAPVGLASKGVTVNLLI